MEHLLSLEKLLDGNMHQTCCLAHTLLGCDYSNFAFIKSALHALFKDAQRAFACKC